MWGIALLLNTCGQMFAMFPFRLQGMCGTPLWIKRQAMITRMLGAAPRIRSAATPRPMEKPNRNRITQLKNWGRKIDALLDTVCTTCTSNFAENMAWLNNQEWTTHPQPREMRRPNHRNSQTTLYECWFAEFHTAHDASNFRSTTFQIRIIQLICVHYHEKCDNRDTMRKPALDSASVVTAFGQTAFGPCRFRPLWFEQVRLVSKC